VPCCIASRRDASAAICDSLLQEVAPGLWHHVAAAVLHSTPLRMACALISTSLRLDATHRAITHGRRCQPSCSRRFAPDSGRPRGNV